jgi:tetratricopeptide (TPR) repeat protein
MHMPHGSSRDPGDAPSEARARALLNAGIAASQGNDLERALSLFAQASAAMPGWGLPHFLSGSEYASLGQWDKAEAELANAVLLSPDLHLARYQLGLLQFSSGRAAAALVTWQSLLAEGLEPSLADFVRGFAALAQDAFEDARAHFERGLANAGVNPAVAGDIQKVLHNFPAAAQAGSAAHALALESSSHVLVANYDRFKLH